MATMVYITLRDSRFLLNPNEVSWFGIIADFIKETDQIEMEFPVDDFMGVNTNVIDGLLEMIRVENMMDWLKQKKSNEIVQVMTFANFLGMDRPEKNVLDCCAKEIANRIRGKSSEEIRELFTD